MSSFARTKRICDHATGTHDSDIRPVSTSREFWLASACAVPTISDDVRLLTVVPSSTTGDPDTAEHLFDTEAHHVRKRCSEMSESEPRSANCKRLQDGANLLCPTQRLLEIG